MKLGDHESEEIIRAVLRIKFYIPLMNGGCPYKVGDRVVAGFAISKDGG